MACSNYDRGMNIMMCVVVSSCMPVIVVVWCLHTAGVRKHSCKLSISHILGVAVMCWNIEPGGGASN